MLLFGLVYRRMHWAVGIGYYHIYCQWLSQTSAIFESVPNGNDTGLICQNWIWEFSFIFSDGQESLVEAAPGVVSPTHPGPIGLWHLLQHLRTDCQLPTGLGQNQATSTE